MISEEYLRQRGAYLAFIERATPEVENKQQKQQREAHFMRIPLPGTKVEVEMEFIVTAYADFIALCYRGEPEKPTMLHIWPDPPGDKDQFYFLFKSKNANERAQKFPAASLSMIYRKWLTKNHVEEKSSFLLPPLVPLPLFGLRGSRDLSFKSDPEIMELDAKGDRPTFKPRWWPNSSNRSSTRTPCRSSVIPIDWPGCGVHRRHALDVERHTVASGTIQERPCVWRGEPRAGYRGCWLF